LTDKFQPLTGNNDQDILLKTTLVSAAPNAPATVTTPTDVEPDLTPVPEPAVNPPPPQAWLDATNLIFGDDGRLLQSFQSPEINKYISKAVRLVNLKVFFTNAFPEPATQSDWLCQCLVNVLQDQALKDQVAHQVNLRAQQDNRYLRSLISMVCYRLSAPPSHNF
jgi:hypothetical protein